MKKSEIPILSKEELRKILICGTNLNNWEQEGVTGLQSILNKHGRVQLDPLNPAGRHHDVLFFSRVPGYKQGDFEKWAYSNSKVFEYYLNAWGTDRVQFAIHIRHFPLFYSKMQEEHLDRRGKKQFTKLNTHHPHALDKARKIVQSNLKVNGKELDFGALNDEVGAWKTNRIGTYALEMLWLLGEAVVTERDNKFQKWYTKTDNFIPTEYKYRPAVEDDQYQYERFLISLQDKSVITLGTIRKSEKINFSRSRTYKPHWFTADEDTPQFAILENTNKLFAIRSDWEELLKQEYDGCLRPISPLDPLIHDRDLVGTLFDFEYHWEVYKPKAKRKWGYYHYPLLINDQLIGRIEVQHDRKQNDLTGFNLIKEEHSFWNNENQLKLYDLLDNWKNMVQADEIHYKFDQKEIN